MKLLGLVGLFAGPRVNFQPPSGATRQDMVSHRFYTVDAALGADQRAGRPLHNDTVAGSRPIDHSPGWRTVAGGDFALPAGPRILISSDSIYPHQRIPATGSRRSPVESGLMTDYTKGARRRRRLQAVSNRPSGTSSPTYGPLIHLCSPVPPPAGHRCRPSRVGSGVLAHPGGICRPGRCRARRACVQRLRVPVPATRRGIVGRGPRRVAVGRPKPPTPCIGGRPGTAADANAS
jgi:hypothetical protein